MFRKLRTLLLASLGTVAICCGAGLSYWFYAQTHIRDIKSGAEVEDIYENYNSGKPNPINQYEMYVFPSTWYLSQYNSNTQGLPELKYGYIERSINENNEIVDVYVNPQGVKSELVDINYTYNYCNDIDNYDERHTSSFKTFKAPKFKASGGWFEADVGYEPQFNEGNNTLKELFITDRDSFSSKPDRSNYEQPSGNKGFNDFSSPEIDSKDIAGVRNDGSFQETEDTSIGGTEGKPIYQQLNIDDRLGYWYEKDAEHGRFLPIKISFSGSLSPQTFLRLVPNPRSDMADANAWHNFAFCNWVYYNPSLDSSKPYNEPIDGFSNHDRKNIFDVLLNLESVSYENKGTGKREIRLFPVFSNGKDYPGSVGGATGNFDPNVQGKGFRDGMKVEYITEDENKNIDMQARYFTFHEGKQDIEYNGNRYNYAVLNNFNTDDRKLKYINFAGVYTYYDNNRGTYSNAQYGNWENFDAGSNITNLEQGDKNIYAITTNNKYSTEQEARNAMQNLVNTMKMGDNPEVNSYKGLFGWLKDRELNAIYNNATDKNNIFVVSNNENGKPDQYRAYALFFERILDLKAITGFPVSNTPITEDNTKIYKETNQGGLIKHYEDVYDISRNLFSEDNYFYIGKKEGTNVFRPDSLTPLNETNQFIYKINTLDLSKESLKFFNIRIEKYNSILSQNLRFDLSPLENGKILFENNTGKLTGSTGTINGDESNTLINASEYFEEIKFRGVDKDNPQLSFDTKGFKVKETETNPGLGFYSIVLVYNPSKGFTFDVYAYKHKNLFVKIFDTEPEVHKTGEQAGFLNHEPTDTLYYEKIYDYSEIMNDTNEFTGRFNEEHRDKKKINDVVNEFAQNRHDSSTGAGDGKYKDFTGERADGTIDNDEIYYIVDHVTKTILCKATYNTSTDTFDIVVNGGIKLDVVKNYVLYVITDTQYRSNKYNPLIPFDQTKVTEENL